MDGNIFGTRVQFSIGDRTWVLDGSTIDIDESIAVQKVTERRWVELCLGFDHGDAEAIKALLWLARRRAGEDIGFHDPAMRFYWKDFSFRYLQVEPAPAQEFVEPEPESAPAHPA